VFTVERIALYYAVHDINEIYVNRQPGAVRRQHENHNEGDGVEIQRGSQRHHQVHPRYKRHKNI